MNTPLLKPFLFWLVEKTANTATPFNEVSEHFPRAQINLLFDRALQERLSQLRQHSSDGEKGMGIRSAAGVSLDWTGYISKSLRSAGIPEHDLDAMVSRVVVKFLVHPGSLFRNWDGEGPIEARFKRSVRNMAISLGQEKKGKSMQSIEEPGINLAARTPTNDPLLDLFSAHIGMRLGQDAEWVFSQLRDGWEKKELVGRRGLTSYRVKQIVQNIKKELWEFSQDDPVFQQSVEKLLKDEEITFQKRREAVFGR